MEISDFDVNEAWLIFKVNSFPIETEEGNANIYLIIDAASTFILGNIFVFANTNAVSEIKVLEELDKCWSENKEWPANFYVEENDIVCQEIMNILKIKELNVKSVKRNDMDAIIKEVCDAFMERF